MLADQTLTLKYSRLQLIVKAVVTAIAAAFMILLAVILPYSNDFPIIRPLVAIFGVLPAQIVVGAMGLALLGVSLAIPSLLSNARAALTVTQRGLHVRALLFRGLIPWSAIDAIEHQPKRESSSTPEHIAVHRRVASNPLLDRIGAGTKLAIEVDGLVEGTEDVLRWIASARGENSSKAVNTPRPATPLAGRPAFGRKA